MFISTALGKAPGLMGLAMNPLTIGAFGLVGSEKVGLGATGNTVRSTHTATASTPSCRSSSPRTARTAP